MAYQTTVPKYFHTTSNAVPVESSVLTPIVKAPSYIIPMTNQRDSSKVAPKFHPARVPVLSESQELTGRRQLSQDTQNEDTIKEVNGSLPEILSNDSSKPSKKNIEKAIANLHKNIGGQGEQRQFQTHGTDKSFSQMPLSSSKRPQISIGF